MGDAARRAQPGEPRQPARGRQEREALVVRQPAVRLVEREAPGATSSREEHPYHHSTIGSMEDLDAASLEDVSAFFRTYYAPNNAVLSIVGDVEPAQARAWARALLRRHPGQPGHPAAAATCRCRRRSARSAARRSATASRCRASTSASARRSSATRGSTRSRSPARSSPAARAAGSHRRLVRDERIAQDVVAVHAGVHRRRARSPPAGRRPGRASTSTRVEAAYHEELERLAPRARHRRRAGARARRSSRPTSWARCSGSRSAPTGCRCTRPCSTIPDLINHDAAALPRGHRRSRSATSPRSCSAPDNRARPDLPAEAGGRRRRASRRRAGTRAPRHERVPSAAA